MAVSTYYFDGHNGITDPDSAWTNEAYVFDGDPDTSTCGISGSSSSNYLLGKGTTAPSSGGEITQVRAKIMGTNTTWVTLDEPTGGWTWGAVSELEVRVWNEEITKWTTYANASVYAQNGELPPLFLGTTVRTSILVSGIEIEITYTESGTTAYSRESSANLKTDDSNLSTMFSEQDYTDVATDDDTFVNLEGISQYFQLLFKEPNANENNTDDFKITWKGKSSLAPSSSTVYLQIYNRTTESWTTLVSNSSANADTEFTLEDTVNTDLSDYYDTNYIISVRVYQDGVV